MSESKSATALVPPPIKPLTKALSKSSLPSVIALLTNSFVAPCTKPPTTFSGTMFTPVPDATPKFSASIPPGFSPPTTALARVCAGSMLPVLANCPTALDTPAAPAVPNAPPPNAPLMAGPATPAVNAVAAAPRASLPTSKLVSTNLVWLRPLPLKPHT